MSIKEDIDALLTPTNQVDWYYYSRQTIKQFPFTSPEGFIDDLFRTAQKQMLIINQGPEYNGTHKYFRASHSVSAYFIGILLARNIQRIGDFEINYPHLNLSFYYLWNLVCLFHDQGYGIESNKQLAEELLALDMPEWYMYKANKSPEEKQSYYRMRAMRHLLDINSSIWFGPYAGHFGRNVNMGTDADNFPSNQELARTLRKFYIPNTIQIKAANGQEIKVPSFPSKTISRYFDLRLTLDGKCDHGIVGGFLFFDCITKNYIKAFQSEFQENRNSQFSNFVHNGLLFCGEQIPIFAYIADCIISHNLWEPGENLTRVNTYKEYGLDLLIGKAYPKVNLNNPLLFVLAIADTIDPIKVFCRGSVFSNIQMILESINLHVSNNTIDIQINNCSLDFNRYCNEIKNLQDWVEVSVDIKPQSRAIHIHW
ncbi:hypothetical protein [Sinanaerobacter chloroacetimidivorans]|uniref:Uncharacterized protein n=1 Tax=Sinanaerobacter chloroacetimidivorans TaxID=2818044 RepID=A0A8J8B2B9_9FIRM|nr:hypothetical protein [Sinanaerobacter chloroacetimidivorans]MBR0598601.1 hypothetical protein [Sinanaerobacter chloroacetimidivorans]